MSMIEFAESVIGPNKCEAKTTMKKTAQWRAMITYY